MEGWLLLAIEALIGSAIVGWGLRELWWLRRDKRLRAARAEAAAKVGDAAPVDREANRAA